MTIQFHGHVESVSKSGDAPGRVEVHVVTDHTVCPKELWINVPAADVQHWLVGRCVSITAYAFDAPQQGKLDPNASTFSQMDEMP